MCGEIVARHTTAIHRSSSAALVAPAGPGSSVERPGISAHRHPGRVVPGETSAATDATPCGLDAPLGVGTFEHPPVRRAYGRAVAVAGTGSVRMRELAADLVRIGRFVPVRSFQTFGYLCGGLLVAQRAGPRGRLPGRRRSVGRSAVVAQADRVRPVLRPHPGHGDLADGVPPAPAPGRLAGDRRLRDRLAGRGLPHLDADVAGRRVALQRDHRLRRHGVLADGAAGVARGAGERGRHPLGVRPAGRATQPRARDPPGTGARCWSARRSACR